MMKFLPCCMPGMGSALLSFVFNLSYNFQLIFILFLPISCCFFFSLASVYFKFILFSDLVYFFIGVDSFVSLTCFSYLIHELIFVCFILFV